MDFTEICDGFCAELREHFLKHKDGMHLITANNILRKKFGVEQPRGVLVYLRKKNRIILKEFEKVTPVISDEEMAVLNRGEAHATDFKIERCLAMIDAPSTPNDILKKFQEVYGNVKNVESFTRMIRKMHEDGKIERTIDGLYLLRFRQPELAVWTA